MLKPIALLASLLLLTTPAMAHPPVITHAYVQQTMAGQHTAIATFTITNPSTKTDRLLMVWFKASREAHIVRMRGLSIINKGLYLPPHGRITLTTQTAAVLLTRLRNSIRPEMQPYEAILTFENAGEVRANFTVIHNGPNRPLMRTKPIAAVSCRANPLPAPACSK